MKPEADATVPLCFDTSAIFGERQAPTVLRKIRDAFPTRSLLVPSWVVAERVRQLRAKYGERFDLEPIRAFLDNPDLELQVVAFDHEIALGGWLEAVGDLAEPWAWERRPLPQTRVDQPCAERCRAGDHIVQAVALQAGALLVTADRV